MFEDIWHRKCIQYMCYKGIFDRMEETIISFFTSLRQIFKIPYLFQIFILLLSVKVTFTYTCMLPEALMPEK